MMYDVVIYGFGYDYHVEKLLPVLLLFIPQMTMPMMVIKLQLEKGNQAPCGANSLNGFNTLVSLFSSSPSGS